MKYISVPVKFNILSKEEVEKLESLDMPIGEEYIEDGVLHIVPSNISTFNEDNYGNTCVVTNDGVAHMVFVKIMDFKKMIDEF